VVFSFVGRIVKDKGIGELVSAFRKLLLKYENDRKIKPKSVNLFLLLIGPFEQHLNPLDSEDYAFLHNHSNVILAGFQSDVRPWILASDVFVFPSYREGFPNVVLQASCLKVPCIVSDINGCNEIIQHEQTGLIVKPKDSDQLYEAMLSLVLDKNKQLLFGEASRRYVVANFDQQFVWGELLKEYKTLTGFGLTCLCACGLTCLC
jgi:glycosyltransferase involved in cell wall biosynthesis